MASQDVDGQSAYRSRYAETSIQSLHRPNDCTGNSFRILKHEKVRTCAKRWRSAVPNPLGVGPADDDHIIFKRRFAFSDPRRSSPRRFPNAKILFPGQEPRRNTPVQRVDACAGNSQANTRQSRRNQGIASAAAAVGGDHRSVEPEGGHLSPFGCRHHFPLQGRHHLNEC
jgi:hypothetical protein